MELRSTVIKLSPRAAPRGFTLAECLIASVVLAVGVLGVAGTLAVSSSQSDSVDVDARSLSLARQLMEHIASLPFDNTIDANDGQGGGDLGGGLDAGGVIGGEITGGGELSGSDEGALGDIGDASMDSGKGGLTGGIDVSDSNPGNASGLNPTLRSLADYDQYTDTIKSTGTSLVDTITFTRTVSVQFRDAPADATVSTTGDMALVKIVVTPSSLGAPVMIYRAAWRFKQVKN